MATNPFRNCIVYRADTDGMIEALLDIDHANTVGLSSVPPTGLAWSTIGLWPLVPGKTRALSLRRGVLFNVRIRQRVLPGKVVKDMVNVRLSKLRIEEGRKLLRTEVAQVRDQVEAELLPKAFIRSSDVAVFLGAKYLLVFTSSAKRADDVVSLLIQAAHPFNANAAFRIPKFKRDVSDVLTEIARSDSGATDETSRGSWFRRNGNVTLIGKGGEKVTVRNRDLDHREIQTLIAERHYHVTDLSLNFIDPEQTKADNTDGDVLETEHLIELNVGSTFALKGILYCGVLSPTMKRDTPNEIVHEWLAFAEIALGSLGRLITAFTEIAGGDTTSFELPAEEADPTEIGVFDPIPAFDETFDTQGL